MSAAEFALTYVRGNPDLLNPLSAWGQCAFETEHLVGLLAEEGHDVVRVQIRGAEYPGREHWAVGVTPDPDNLPEGLTIIDVTARQFRADVTVPYIDSLDEWLDDACEWLTDGLVVTIYAADRHLGMTMPLWTDRHSREEIEPGPLVYPWEVAAL